MLVTCAFTFLLILSFRTASFCSEPYAYPLEQILAIAKAHATELTLIATEAEASLTEVTLYKAEALPHVNLQSNVGWLSASRQAEQFSTALTLPSLQQYPDQGWSVTSPNRLQGTRIDWDVRIEQPLITFGKVSSALTIARMRYCTHKDIARLKRDEFYLRVIKEFAEALTAQQDVSINMASVDRSKQLALRLTSDYESGRASRRELLRTEAQLLSDRAHLIAAKGVAATAKKRLFQTINFGETADSISLELDESSTSFLVSPPSGPGSVRYFLKKNEAALLKAQVKSVRALYFPTLNLVGSLGTHFLAADTGRVVERLLPAGSTFSETSAMESLLDKYNPSVLQFLDPSLMDVAIGVGLSWDIFDGFRTGAKLRQAKLRAKQSLIELELLEKSDKVAAFESQNRIATIDSTIAAVKLHIEAARLALMQTEQDFKDGVADFSTFLATDKEYRDAVRQHLDYKIQRLLALAELRIILGYPVYGEEP